MAPKSNTIICVTGMHRSGTSLTTSWLEMCGLPVHDGSFHGPAVGNPKGHFEDKEFVGIHEAAITSHHPDSKGWKVFSGNKISFSKIELNRLQEFIDVRNRKFPVWGWKDPRSVLFLEDWKTIIPELKVLLIWRPCSEVVRSLVSRSRKATLDVFKINPNESVKLWHVYNSKLLEFKKKFPDDTLLLPLRSLLKTDRKVLLKINQVCQTQLNYSPIKSVFDTNLLKNKRTSVLMKFFCRIHNSQTLENELMASSDFSLP